MIAVTHSHPFKRRNTAYRDCRGVKDGELSAEDLAEEKKYVKEQFSFVSTDDHFEICYVQSDRYNKMRRMFKCMHQDCGRTFTKTWNLFDHLRTHSGDKPFICRVCGRGFAQNGNLTKHIRVHYEKNRNIYK
mmetsp:Transcript_8873/g.10040  ORF Transcript_8873/g.10040 Transcript_8873/m.10040 type:complete len:132 (-) Transcript_8873:72-467(-)